MGKLNISFNNNKYSIDEYVLSDATNSLKSHLSTIMNGSGTTITFDGVTYNIDSTKLSTTINDFISHLETISGNGSKVIVNGVEYSIDTNKIQSAITEIENVLGNINNPDSDDSNSIVLLSSDNYILQDSTGVYLIAKEDN